MNPPTTIRAGFGAPALDALTDAISAAKADDAMAAVTVVPPSVYAGLLLRRSLAHRTGGLVNVSFQPLARVADTLGTPRLRAAGRRPLPSAYAATVVRQLIVADPRDFGAVAHHGATVRALLGAFHDLRRAAPSALHDLRAIGGRPAHLVDLLDSFVAATAAFYDAVDVTLAAAASLRDGTVPAHALAEVGHVVLYLPRALGAPDRELHDALASDARLSVVEGDAADMPKASHVVIAPDAEGELRAAAAEVVRRLERGIHAEALAVLHGGNEPYERLAVEVLRAEGIPVAGPPVATLADTVAGRTVLGLLEIARDDFPRAATMAWLGGSPIVDGDGNRVPLARWERASRDANVVGGVQQWSERLHAAAVLAGGDGSRRPYGVEAFDGLRAFVADLAEHARVPGNGSTAATWTEIAEWLVDLVGRYLGPPTVRAARWPDTADTEIDACGGVETALHALGAIDEVAPPPTSLSEIVDIVSTQLDRPWGRAGAIGSGVFVGPVSLAVGAEFDTVVVVGMAEGRFPPRRRDDPLLPDDVRTRVGLDTRRARRQRDRADLSAVIASAARSVLTVPRADERAQQRRLASPWLLDATPAPDGERLSAEDLDRLDAQVDWLTSFASFDDEIRRGQLPSEQELSLASLRAGAQPGNDLERALAAARARAGDAVTEWDGNPGPHEHLTIADDRALSPSALETWATCPTRYFFRYGLDVKGTRQPEDSDRITALDRGTLVHSILEQFMREVRDRDWRAPWTTGERARLRDIAEAACADAEQRGLTGRALWWLLDKRAVHKHIGNLLDVDAADRAEDGVRPVLFEFSFGLPDADIGAVVIETPNGRTRRFRGKADRLDTSTDESVAVVIDYKTGKSKYFEMLVPKGNRDIDPVVGGTKLQLPVYALAAAARFPNATVKAAYWFVTDDARGYRRIPVELDARTDARFREVVGLIVDGIEDGVFPMNPGELQWRDWQNCKYCDFDRICPVDRGDSADRRHDDTSYVRFRTLQPEAVGE